MDILEFIDKGGIIVYILIFLNIIGFAVIIYKFLTLPQIKKILQENDFASADKTPEEKYIQQKKKKKLVKVIEIEKYKKTLQ